jgi:pyruvate,water dikinase
MSDLINSVIEKGKQFIRDRFAPRQVTFKVMFLRFRQVLENHNKAIEIIADMGEKLGGDYIFDITFIKNSYASLYSMLAESLASFNVLTQNRYPRLKDVFSRIDKDIRLLVDGETSSLQEFVLPYSALTWRMAGDAGGKNANLAELKNNVEINVPDAFAITAFSYDEFMRQNRIVEMLSALKGDDAQTEAELHKIRTAVLEGGIPSGLQNALERALSELKARFGEKCFLAVRSSAEAEDSEFSFAGQFETVLNVPCERLAVQEAYKRVVASLFSDKAAAYYRKLGMDIGRIRMAVGCLLMVDAVVSGVVYSVNPKGDDGTIIINSTWGLGTSVVEGQTDADYYLLKKDAVPEIISKRTGKKETMVVSSREGGIASISTPADVSEKSSLTEEQVLELARQTVRIENYFRQPQDIEWAIDREGRIFILQARPLRIADSGRKGDVHAMVDTHSRVLMKARGQVVQKGAAAGRVFVFKPAEGLAGFLKGNVLVARNDSSDFIRVMPYASAIITDIGSLTSHMASLCREFRVPAFVNAGNATQILNSGQEVTVIAGEEDTVTVYDGILPGIAEYSRSGRAAIEDIYEYRKKRYVLRYISPLNLVDPLMEKFSPEGCKTMHDVLRFIHEKSVMELVDNALRGLKGQAAVKLDLPIPAGIIVVDIGEGLLPLPNPPLAKGEERGGKVSPVVTFEQVSSIPFRAVLQGMMHPGAWHSEPVSLRVNDFMTSMMRMPDIVSGEDSHAANNVAVVSREYLNLSLRFGYHFNMIDCFCSETARNNHLYFRFTGGATDMAKRSRRIELISIILTEYGFNTISKGDLIIGRLANMRRDDMENVLDGIGRLIAYTRQLDAVMHDDNKVQRYAKNFLEGRYEL